MKKHFLFLIIPFLFSQSYLSAQNLHESNAPYFLIETEDVGPEHFSLQSTSAEVNIAGPIADVQIQQVYLNDGDKPLEAIYVFPASTRAAVYSMEMIIGKRVIKAEIQEKHKARQNYEEAKSEGKRTSLLEQHTPNVFQMNVANIMPGEKIEIRLKYNEFLIPEAGEYQFVYPTVVGPRFAHPGGAPSYVSNPYLKKVAPVPYTFEMMLKLNSPVPVLKAYCPSHELKITYINSKSMEAILSNENKKEGNRDFIFNYQLGDQQIVSGTLLYEHEDENFFLSVIEPPQSIKMEKLPPREYIFIVDVSGSMHGFPIHMSKKLMEGLLANMRPQDYFNVLLFPSNSTALSGQSVNANPENIQRATSLMNQQTGSGGTHLLEAVQRAMSLPEMEVNASRSLVIITDGYVHVEKETFGYIDQHLGQANFFVFGIGRSVNRHIIEGIAHVGRGKPFIITEPHEAELISEKFRQYIERPILTDIRLSFDGIEAYDITPINIPDLLSERPIYVFGKYSGKPKGKIIVSGFQGDSKYRNSIRLERIKPSSNNSAIRYLWAREKIRHNADFYSLDRNEISKQLITHLGLKYDLLTEFTSFVAIDHEEIANDNGENPVKAKQVLPLPSGVSNYAVGFEMSVDGISTAMGELEEAILFVHIVEGMPSEKNLEIQRFIQNQIRFVDEEARILLDQNPLVISIKNSKIKITDESNRLQADMLIKLEKQLNGLCYLLENVEFKIRLIWL